MSTATTITLPELELTFDNVRKVFVVTEDGAIILRERTYGGAEAGMLRRAKINRQKAGIKIEGDWIRFHTPEGLYTEGKIIAIEDGVFIVAAASGSYGITAENTTGTRIV